FGSNSFAPLSTFNFTTPSSGFSAPQTTSAPQTSQPTTGFGQFGAKPYSFVAAATTGE
ncbi:Nuclear pore glycoprotein p62, partial [Danaus plexippus plexippus]